ncbi:LytR/AlgR family response regulator transcription factor [Flavivirga jejuensis]|uniref:LytTR family DNA-binding domain-containing protein n=1 Tax=Flavivirga jejuensis TaxID=870487 RepID=A0ABT8WMG3_9FLAO|nr:LytTR family DNA-binding domain-containing protein [Flavivirga jejuensis]MDO5974341.1 LytTR family DNA-binding domain-containing protein [Flavivirga jejuensis]
MIIKSIIIDDEVHNLENLKGLLKRNCPNVEVVAMEFSAEEGIEAIRKLQPDLVFLDIEMPAKNGFDMLESMGDVNFEVIFVTAYNQYILQAIKSCALDYLMKPVAIQELKDAVSRVAQVVSDKKENQKLKVLVENLRDINQPKKIALPTAEELYFVSIDDIIRCKGENNYTMFYLANGDSILVSRTLKEWDDMLSSYQFIRTHQSHLINSIHVKSFVKKDGGYILMKDGSMVSVSKHKKEQTLSKLASLR